MAAHAGTHKRGGNDPIRLDDLAEPQDNVDLDANTLRHGLLPKLSGDSSDVLKGDGTFGAGGGTGAATSDHFVTTQAETDLSAEFNLGGLTTGLLKHSVSAGVSTPATAVAATDYVAPGAVTSSGLTQATAKILGRTTASTGAIEEISVGSGLSLSAGSLIATGGSANHAWFTYRAAHLEPLAIEKLQIGSFTYTISGSVTKLLLGSWQTRFSSTGRWEMRDPTQIMPLRGVSLIGTGTDSVAAIIDPALASYTDARTTYYDRLNTLATSTPKYLALTAPSTVYPLLPGPYGIIIIGTTTFDFTWLALRYEGANQGIAVTNEIGDGSGDYQRVTNNAPFPVSRWICGSVLTGVERTSGAGKGGILYVICDSSWGAVTDGMSYIFRDDFMGATLDTGSTWTRSQSTAGNVEINTDFAWCKAKGDTNWGNNGAHSQATTSRSAGKIFECYVWTGDGVGATDTTSGAPSLVVGWHDGAGQSYTDFSHCIDFTQTGSVRALFVFENGNSRGAVGSGYSLRTVYRIRITLGASSATYEIQGGTQYAALGGSSWTGITPGTTSSTTTPLAVGFTINEAVVTYVGDVKAY